MTELKVVVAGGSASGKSAVAELIRQALAISGVKVELLDDNGIGIVDERPGVIAGSLESRISGIASRDTVVKIRTLNTRHEPVFAPMTSIDMVNARRYETMRDWFISGSNRSDIDPHGHIRLTSLEIVDQGVDALGKAYEIARRSVLDQLTAEAQKNGEYD